MSAGIVCCHPDGLAYYQPANAEATAIFPCYHYYGIIAIYYPDMMLGGTLLDDAEMWSSLDSILTFIISGRTSAEHHQKHRASKAHICTEHEQLDLICTAGM